MKKTRSLLTSHRKVTFFMLFCLFAFTSTLKAQRVSLPSTVRTLKQSMNDIEKQTGFKFFYNNKQIDEKQMVKAGCKDESLTRALAKVFANTDISFNLSGKTIVLKKKNVQPARQTPKDRQKVTGTILDEDGNPVIGATIREKGTDKGTISDINGQFELATNPGANLEVTYVGYVSSQVVANGRNITIKLRQDTKLMDDIVVVGYGVQKKSDLTGAVASVTAETIENRPTSNLIQSLEGVIPGLSVSVTGNNAEGSSSLIRIRGSKSIGADNKPLIILDGIPFDGPWSELNPNDIKSIEVLKDASSSAIYGSRGANGVILVTSKRGEKGRLSVNYSGFIAFDKPYNFPDLMNGEEFFKYKEEALRAANSTPPTEDNPKPWMGAFTQTEMEMHEAGRETNWLREVTRTGIRKQHNLSLRGGANKTRFFISLNYTDNQGTARGNNFNRYNIRFNLDQEFTSWLSFSTSTQLGRYDRTTSMADIWRAFRMVPLARAYNDDGTIPNAGWEDSSEAFAINPLNAMNQRHSDLRWKVISNNVLEIKVPFVKGLSYKLNTGYTYSNSSWKQYQGRDSYYGARANGILNTDDWHAEDWIIENIVSYIRDFGKHHLFVTGLYSAQSHVYEQNSMVGKGFPNDVMYFYQMNKAATASGNSNYNKSNHLSQMGRINYSYDNRYLLTLTARRDGYSGFGSDTKFGVFPSMAAGWNISNESFFKSHPIHHVISNMKYRLSWGKNGNEAIGAYSTLPNLATYNYLNDDHTAAYGFYPRKLASPNLSWETTSSINTGLDVTLWNGRIQTSLDLYWSKTKDLLLSRSIPTINGTGSVMDNIGSTKGNGIEWQIISNNITTKNFNWKTTFNITHNQVEIVDVGLYDEFGNPTDDVASRWFIGKPINVNYDYKKIGIWQIEDKNNPEGAQDVRNPFSIPGYIKYEDVNKDGVINTEDRQIIGRTQPTVKMGMSNSFKYKDFYLSFFLSAQIGETRDNALYTCATNNYRQNRLMVNFWTPENPTNDYPKNTADTSVNPMNGGFYEKTDFLRMTDLTFGYRLPKSLLRNFFLSRAEAYVNIRNLFTLTSWTGMDPEFIGSQYATPPVRTFTFVIKLDI